MADRKSALFLMHRIRHAMGHEPGTQQPLSGTLEADETYVGGKIRPGSNRRRAISGTGRKTAGPHARGAKAKIPVMAPVQRGGEVRFSIADRLTAKTVGRFIMENAHLSSRLCTDEYKSYGPVGRLQGRPSRRHAQRGSVRHR